MTTATIAITACPTCHADGDAPCVTATTGKPTRSWHARRPASAEAALAAVEAAEAEAAAVAEIEARANAIAAEQQAKAAAKREAQETAAFTRHGFRCYPRDLERGIWMVSADNDARRRYAQATDDAWCDTDVYDVTAEQLAAQLDDIMGGAPPEKVVLPDESAVIVSPTTGEVYREITPVEHKQELALEAAAALRWEEVEDRKAARAQAELDFQARREEETRRAELEREARQNEIDAQREQWASELAAADRKTRSDDARRLRQQHREQDAQGLQRTNRDGNLLCDSCQRRYHDPSFDFCFSCKRGRGQHEHRQRLDSGEVAARQAARQKVRDNYMAPARAVAAQDKAVAEAHRREVNAELNALLESCGLPLWSGEGFQKYAHNVRLGLRYNGGLREQDSPMVTGLLERASELSPAAHLKISPHLDVLRAGLDRAAVKAGELRPQEQPAQRNMAGGSLPAPMPGHCPDDPEPDEPIPLEMRRRIRLHAREREDLRRQEPPAQQNLAAAPARPADAFLPVQGSSWLEQWSPTLAVGLVCLKRGKDVRPFRRSPLSAACGSEAAVMLIRRDDANITAAFCAEHIPAPDALWRRFRPEDAGRAQLMQAAMEQVWLAAKPTDPDDPREDEAELHAAGRAVRAELKRRLDCLALPDAQLETR